MTFKEYPNGWSVYFDKLRNGWYETYVRDAYGNMHDKMRCDTYAGAREYYRAFQAIAKAA